jgi:hypothetical protein
VIQNIAETVPLVRYLGVKYDDAGLNGYLEPLGKKPKLQVVEYTADLLYKKAGIALSFIQEEWTVSEGTPFGKDVFILRAFFLYSQGHEGFDQYTGRLPKGISFLEDRTIVRASLGEPQLTGGGNSFGKVTFPFWDRYLFESCVLTVSYQNEKAIMLSFMSLNEFSRINPK